ncbi:two-component regulator system yiem receptor component protein [Spiroplasma citri]|uniref:Two-component regulator system yiem receptor component protein n=1 Tax=Spiroplasma citri TaxID=2133 RepID=A0AAX3T088_SPICI|nr:VWA domain-containing protein [Spiroplasma citri]WFG96837.1 two-component regulator system yiem receptor component protein [Spiroplasma citri]WFH00733.1 two-component regulator system yiem receptor component protein [Spiroplasma citri]
MNPYLEQKAGVQLANKLTALKNTDLVNPKFALMKTTNRWLSEMFDQAVNNFYDHQIENEIMKIKLDSNIEKEIYLFHWIKVNGYDGLKKNYASTQDFLFKVSSPFYDRLNYYRYEFNKKQNNNTNMLFRDFIGIWESILIKRINDYRFAKIEELRTKFMQDLYNKVEIYNKANSLLKTVWNFFGKIWNPTELKKGVNMSAIDKFAKFLETNPAIMEIATLLGRFQGESNLIEQRILEEIVMDYEWKPIGSSPEEIIGATESKDLEHMFAAELVLLKDPVLKYIFYKKYIEGKLTTFEFLSQDKVPKEQIKLRTIETYVPEEKGPIILSIDTSSSMRGSPEQIAKALALAIAKIALGEHRPCYMINFSKSLDVYNLSSLKDSLPKLIEFLSKSFAGDTNVEPALEHTLTVMDSNEYFNADLLLISDFLISDLSPELITKINLLKQRRNRFHAIVIGTMGAENVETIFNNAWIYDPRDPFASELIIASLTGQIVNKYDKVSGAKAILGRMITAKEISKNVK